MKLTPMERYERFYQIAEEDPRTSELLDGYDKARLRFEKFTDWLPRRARERLWELPCMGHFLNTRLILLMCEHMKFPDEE